jgi:hypothetical protein
MEYKVGDAVGLGPGDLASFMKGYRVCGTTSRPSASSSSKAEGLAWTQSVPSLYKERAKDGTDPRRYSTLQRR